MKTFIKYILIVLAFTACNNDDDNNPSDPIDQLPPATQTGEGTFGCLLDGEPFLPGSGNNTLDCVYQFINGEFFFSLQANRRNENNNVVLIGISTNHLEILENQSYNLVENNPGNAYGTYALAAQFTHTSSLNSGSVTFTKLDFNNNIVSGTFFFDILDYNGELRQIREGRFDMQFTQ